MEDRIKELEQRCEELTEMLEEQNRFIIEMFEKLNMVNELQRETNVNLTRICEMNSRSIKKLVNTTFKALINMKELT